jgi:hypothetical protein
VLRLTIYHSYYLVNNNVLALMGIKNDFKNGLPCLRCRKPTETDLGLLPHIAMTSDVDWDPNLYDNIVEDLQAFHDTSVDDVDHDNPCHQYGEYCFRTVTTHNTIHEEAFFDAVINTDFNDMVDDVIDILNPEGASNVYDLNLIDVANNTVFSDTPAVDSGVIGIRSGYMKSTSLFTWLHLERRQHQTNLMTKASYVQIRFTVVGW